MALPFPLPGEACAPALIGDPAGSDRGRDCGPAPTRLTGMTHGELRRSLEGAGAALAHATKAKGLLWLLAPNGVPAALGLLAGLASGHALCPLDPGLAPERLADLARRFRPDLVLTPEPAPEQDAGNDPGPPVPGLERVDSPVPGLALWRRPEFLPASASASGSGPVHPELALLMATSGSTGNPRFARLAASALAANTAAIVSVLGLGPEERALGHLPLWYSYGLSVLTSHLSAGGSVVVTGRGLLDGGLWRLARDTRATALAGVPFHWESLLRLDLARLDVPSLRLFTQAGGRLAPELVHRAARMCERQAGGRFHVMYGQTEAAPRITTLPAAEAGRRPGSVGPALPGGRLEILTARGPTTEAGVVGEVVCYGANIMMGYAETREDLALGDRLGGRLATGDQGFLDADGFLTLTGRIRPFAKLYGLRLDLADIEAAAEVVAPVVAFQDGERLVLVTCEADPATHRLLRAAVMTATGLPVGAVTCRAVPAFPRLASGKIDRRLLEAGSGAPAG